MRPLLRRRRSVFFDSWMHLPVGFLIKQQGCNPIIPETGSVVADSANVDNMPGKSGIHDRTRSFLVELVRSTEMTDSVRTFGELADVRSELDILRVYRFQHGVCLVARLHAGTCMLMQGRG